MKNITARLFGLKNSNRDFSKSESWGKNQFNSSFPASLPIYLDSLGLKNIYIKIDSSLKIVHDNISTNELYGVDCSTNDAFFAFESTYLPYQQFLIGETPRVDLVVLNKKNSLATKGLEIKLTALPDITTYNLSEDNYGSEIVVRPDTIVYLACSIALLYKDKISELRKFFNNDFDSISDWSNAENILPYLRGINSVINNICIENIDKQEPLILQPIWKTEGKSPCLSDNCLDVFVWSNLAFIKLFALEDGKTVTKISRHNRSLIWLFKMLFDFSRYGQFDHKHIIDELSYNTKNDKAFSVSGAITKQYMKCNELTLPRITKNEIKNIILGEGQNLLSPERRFDAIIFNSPDLF